MLSKCFVVTYLFLAMYLIDKAHAYPLHDPREACHVTEVCDVSPSGRTHPLGPTWRVSDQVKPLRDELLFSFSTMWGIYKEISIWRARGPWIDNIPARTLTLGILISRTIGKTYSFRPWRQESVLMNGITAVKKYLKICKCLWNWVMKRCWKSLGAW